jgi:hypothetical protein
MVGECIRITILFLNDLRKKMANFLRNCLLIARENSGYVNSRKLGGQCAQHTVSVLNFLIFFKVIFNILIVRTLDCGQM